jgi:hypothetical protein
MSWKDVLKADDDIEKLRGGTFGTRNIRDLGRRLTGGSPQEREERQQAKRTRAAIKTYFNQSLIPELKQLVSQERTGQRLPIVVVIDGDGMPKLEEDRILFPVRLMDVEIEPEDVPELVMMTMELFKKKKFNVSETKVDGKRALEIKQ